MDERCRVLCVDDNADVAGVLSVVISSEDDMECVGTLDSADRLLETIEAKHPDVVLMDLTMPGRDPLDAMREAQERFPETRTIILSGYDDRSDVDRAINHGAWGYASKKDDMPTLLALVRRVARGEFGEMSSV